MKRLIFLFLLISSFGFTQTTPGINYLLGNAYEFYQAERYSQAITLYEEAMAIDDQNAEVNYQLAESYRHCFRYQEAEIYYEKVTYMDAAAFPLSYYYLGLMKKYNGKYREAIQSLSRFLEINVEGRYPLFVEQAYIEQSGASRALEDPVDTLYKILSFPEPVNSSFNDFNSAHLNDSILFFTSGRTEKSRNVDLRYGEGFTDIYSLTRTDNGWENVTKMLIRNLNSKYNDGSGAFNRNRTVYYFTGCGTDKPECIIYKTEHSEGKWSDPEPLPETINRKGYNSKQPALSFTGDSLFFVSDRPGGFGNNDIWLSIRTGDAQWGPPVNLGSSVNTRLDDVSPAVTVLSNVLFFASNGHQGFGGFDIFMARRLSSGDTTTINIGQPLNSSRDELYPELFENEFYWSSNRDGGQGAFDLYSSATGPPIKFISRLSLRGNARRSEVSLMAHRQSDYAGDIYTLYLEDKMEYEKLSDQEKKLVDRLVRGEDPDEVLKGRTNRSDLIRISERRRSYNARRYSFPVVRNITVTNPFLVSGKINSRVLDDLSGIRLYLKDSLGQILMITGVSEVGDFQFSNLTVEGPIFIEPEIYGSSDSTLYLTDIRMTSMPEPLKELENIYFDLDRYTLRAEAMKSLEVMAGLLLNNEDSQVEIWAFADETGSDEYNQILTKERALAVFNYLRGKGVSGNQLMINPRGKEFAEDKARSGIERQLSRRVEFKVSNLYKGSEPAFTTCFTLKKVLLEDLLKELNLTKEEFREWNGELNNDMRAYQPFRLEEPVSVKSITCPD